jgi:hypothetical protein
MARASSLPKLSTAAAGSEWKYLRLGGPAILTPPPRPSHGYRVDPGALR